MLIGIGVCIKKHHSLGSTYWKGRAHWKGGVKSFNYSTTVSDYNDVGKQVAAFPGWMLLILEF